MKIKRTKVTPQRNAVEVTQNIISITHVIGSHVHVVYTEGSVDDLPPPGTTLKQRKDIVIDKQYYEELLSEKPKWAKQKPAGSFKEADILTLLDTYPEIEL